MCMTRMTEVTFSYVLLESGRVMGLRFDISFGGTVIACIIVQPSSS